jgi:hypothetical protein
MTTTRANFYYWNEEFFGGIRYFVLLVVAGAVCGVIGGCAGLLLAAITPPKTERAEQKSQVVTKTLDVAFQVWYSHKVAPHHTLQ